MIESNKNNAQTEIVKIADDSAYEKINNQFANVACLFDLLGELSDVTECNTLSGGVAAVHASFMALWENFDEADKTDDSNDGPDSVYSKLMNECYDVHSLIDMLFFNPRIEDNKTVHGAVFAIQNQFKRIWDAMGSVFPHQPECCFDDGEEAMAA